MKGTIPKTVMVGSANIQIRQVKQPMLDGNPIMGWYSAKTCEIQIQDSLSLERKWIVLLHELMHAAIDIADADVDIAEALGSEAEVMIEHAFIRALTSEFIGTLRRNGWLKLPGVK